MRNVNFAAIYHMPWLEYRHALTDGRVCLRIRTARGDFDRVSARHTCGYFGDDPFKKAQTEIMHLQYHDEMFDYYECVFEPMDARVKYLFILVSGEITVKLDAAGVHMGADYPETPDDAFVFAYAYPADKMPEWARGCVGYQIFPDRFRRSEDAKSDNTIEPWTSKHYENEYRFGGNLQGIREAVPYLKKLGVDVIYTNPLFVSDSSHRYNTFDYYTIDPLLGTEKDLKELCDTLHESGMRLVLDGVFNHSGTGFEPFIDAKKNGAKSKFYDWFFFDDSEIGYKTFGFAKYMPKLNLKNEACAEYFLDVGRYWLEKCGIDGWRLDVSPEVYPEFWRRYHSMMKKANPDSLMIAECWDDSREWLTIGDMFDSTMNYVLSRAIWSRFAEQSISCELFDARVNQSMMLYPLRTQDVLWNFLGSHDTPRFRTRAGGSEKLLRAAAYFQMACTGVPIIYYGDELGMEGKGDPDCRRPMRWGDTDDNATLAFYQRLTEMRKESDALRYGSFKSWEAKENGLYAFLRVSEKQSALVIINTTGKKQAGTFALPPELHGKKALKDAFSAKALKASGSVIEIKLNAGEGVTILY
ncbi:MAG: glycoside hydrolase family 13 protein [Eubacteriales bacterium]|nr:glycoside hydrolase family 13 protein [Eubacteriales bacterium]MDD3882055.1 glycoside hydrolase family 13 protein [Eubacteriales bacterium]MDD4512502.1 glycoside hydrolase family 13 protein [Eubacteriales bacterium]